MAFLGCSGYWRPRVAAVYRFAGGPRRKTGTVRADPTIGPAAAIAQKERGIAEYPRSPVSVAWWSLLDDDRALHIRMELAEVVEGAGLGEGEAEGFARVDLAGLEAAAAGLAHRVRRLIVVGPGHRRADRDLQLARVER